ncbi:uncharacterized protein LOC106069627 isoform X2 [Biomphalaria glabrata]|uniref:Uncharacterized protein LOC106069627 isoform X2 n=1 Tax=Biomphalaria glabrata TaxID=6526 RepID=A0A9W2Z6B5_BIOGL|nr:uncharacterized protein LOC106069627 isoform X2 [Biomphalaria glabrata]
MRPLKELSDIASRLEELDNFKELLQTLIQNISKVAQKGEAWADESGDLNYSELKQIILIETEQCVQSCLEIAQHYKGTSALTSKVQSNHGDPEIDSMEDSCSNSQKTVNNDRDFSRVEQDLSLLNIEELESTAGTEAPSQKLTMQTDKLLSLTDSLSTDINHETFKGIIKELQAMREDISSLKSVMEPWTSGPHLEHWQNNTKSRDVYRQDEQYLKPLGLFAEELALMKSLKQDNKQLLDDLANYKELLTAREYEIQSLQRTGVELKENLKYLNFQYVELKEDIVECYNFVEKQENEIEQMSIELKSARKSVEDYKVKMEKIKSDIVCDYRVTEEKCRNCQIFKDHYCYILSTSEICYDCWVKELGI